MSDPKTVFVTKYALTGGIHECLVSSMDVDGYAYLRRSIASYNEFFSPKNYSLTLEDAQRVAEDMRTKKIAALLRQVDKLATAKIKVKRLTQENSDVAG